MVVSYEEAVKNNKLSKFLRDANPSDEEAIESVIMDNEGLTTKETLNALKSKYGKIISFKKLERKIIEINRKYIDEIGIQIIVYHNKKWIWRGTNG